MKNCLAIVVTALFSIHFANADTKFDPPEASQHGVYQIAANWSEMHHGWSVLTIKLTDATKAPVKGAELQIDYDMTGMPMSPPQKPVVEKDEGIYEKKVFFGMTGEYFFDFKIKAKSSEDTFSHKEVIKK